MRFFDHSAHYYSSRITRRSHNNWFSKVLHFSSSAKHHALFSPLPFQITHIHTYSLARALTDQSWLVSFASSFYWTFSLTFNLLIDYFSFHFPTGCFLSSFMRFTWTYFSYLCSVQTPNVAIYKTVSRSLISTYCSTVVLNYSSFRSVPWIYLPGRGEGRKSVGWADRDRDRAIERVGERERVGSGRGRERERL